MKFDRDRMIEEVIRMRIKDMASTATILKYIMETAGVKQTQAYVYLSEAQKTITEMYKDNRKTAFEDAIAQLQTLMEQAETTKEKLDIRKELNKIQGLYIDKIELSGEVVFKAKFDDANTNDTDISDDI